MTEKERERFIAFSERVLSCFHLDLVNGNIQKKRFRDFTMTWECRFENKNTGSTTIHDPNKITILSAILYSREKKCEPIFFCFSIVPNATRLLNNLDVFIF